MWRVLLALFLAPGVAAFIIAALMPGYDGLEFYFERVWRTAVLFWLFGGLPASLILGFPSYLALRNRIRPTPVNCAIVGGIAAALPWLLLSGMSLPDNAYSGGGRTVVDGRRTLHGWLELAKFVAAVTAAGGLGGVTFWTIAKGASKRLSG